MTRVALRPVRDGDLEALFEQSCDVAAVHMVGFTRREPGDRVAFDAHWREVRGDEGIVVRAILADDVVVGHVLHFRREGVPEIGYWIDRAWWGRGVATEAVRRFLPLVPTRPLHARVIADNLGSQRVLERNGFVAIGRERSHSTVRGIEVEEILYALEA